jgi:hypothetical protein
MKKWFYTILCLACIPELRAQDPVQTELAPVEVEIVRERKIVLPEANRIFEKIPPREVEPVRPEITYQFRPLDVQTPLFSPVIRPFRVRDEAPAPAQQGFISAGYGNYASPYLEAFYNSSHNKNQLLGAHAYHSSSGRGPVDGKNSASGTSGLSLFAQSFGKALTYNAQMGLHQRFTHFYGYRELPVSRDTLRQSFLLFNASAGISNSKKSKFNYGIQADFSYLDDKRSASESTQDINFNASYRVNEQSELKLDAFFSLMSRKDTDLQARPRSLFSAHPAYTFSLLENLRVRIGAVLAYENDTLDARNFHAYPDLQATYRLSQSIELLGTVNGGLERVSLQTITRENNWVAPRIALNHTNTLLNVESSARVRVRSFLTLQGGFSLAALRNFYGFLNDSVRINEFQVVYDSGITRRTNLFASIHLSHGNQFGFLVRGDLFRYNTATLAEAWHRPGYRTTLQVTYLLKEKLRIESEFITMGDIRALDPVLMQQVKLRPAADLNLRLDYLISSGFSVFLRFNNITDNRYSTLLNYPVRGFQILGGITWSF